MTRSRREWRPARASAPILAPRRLADGLDSDHRSRVEQVGGRLSLRGGAAGGTELELEVPA